MQPCNVLNCSKPNVLFVPQVLWGFLVSVTVSYKPTTTRPLSPRLGFYRQDLIRSYSETWGGNSPHFHCTNEETEAGECGRAHNHTAGEWQRRFRTDRRQLSSRASILLVLHGCTHIILFSIKSQYKCDHKESTQIQVIIRTHKTESTSRELKV